MKKYMFLVAVLVMILGMVGLVVGMQTDSEENMDYIKGTILVNGVEVEAEDTVLIRTVTIYERTRLGVLTTEVERMLFPMRTILEALGSTVTWDESTGNIFFDFAGEEYVAWFRILTPRSPEDTFVYISKIENMYTMRLDEMIQLNPMAGNGIYRIINDRTYLSQDTGQRLFEALGCRVEVDIENRVLRIYSN